MSYSSKPLQRNNCEQCGFFTFDERPILACPYQEKGCPLVVVRPWGARFHLVRRALGFVFSTIGVIAVMMLVWMSRPGG